ncbi:MAG TPA: exodeoxyribonuclease VII large subunit [Geminicoccaceae bacterium]
MASSPEAAPALSAPLLPGNVPEYSVSELSGALRRSLEDGFGHVRVRGEISGFKCHSSGHCYFALKDEKACLDAVCFRREAGRLRFRPEDGLEVVVEGRITTYPSRSKYQIVIERMAPAGAGALMALLEERKRKLAAEGLFDADQKRAIPFLPEVIGVVTSPTGAVIRDILHRLEERFPRHVLVWPVLVQGEAAAGQVAAAIEGFNRLAPGGRVPRPDLLIVARGGGSIEDLWAFNEEVVVRAAAASSIPLISAVGHETDTTLIDFAADRRAPTPTAAAELAVPVRSELLLRLQQLEGRAQHGAERDLRVLGQTVTGLARGLPDPNALLQQAAQRLDDLGEHLPRALERRLERDGHRVQGLAGRLRAPADVLQDQAHRLQRWSERLDRGFAGRIRERAQRFEGLAARLGLDEVGRRLPRHARALEALAGRQEHAIERRRSLWRGRLDALSSRLESVSYAGVLGRGFALVRAADGALVKSADVAERADHLEVEFVDGRVTVVPAGRGRRRSERRDPAPAGRQGSLL